ncbi:MAG: glycosyltransferase family 39 protein [Pseudomonadota bacterium]|nr:glycosyltransferase family 39 protein [Pseudomonadota bacterium]
MTFEDRLDGWGRGWRGPLLAAIVALIAGLPGLIALPPLDRDEARFAQASAQMLESGDFVNIRFQDTPRYKKPVGIYWLQAASVATLSHVEDRQIWAWRVPSLLGAMLAAAACAWGAAAFLRPAGSLIAGALLGASFMLSTEAAIAATDAVLCGVVTLAMAALARLYLAAREGPPAGWRSKGLFWLGLSLSVLIKGPIGPMVVALTLAALCLWDRRVAWLKTLGWGWGLIFLLAVVGPWAMAITVASDGAFWGAAAGGDLAPKLLGDQEGHGAPPGFYLVLLPVLIFPACLLLPAGAVAAWRARAEPAVRFALCWLVPTWLVFEAAPTKLVHYTLPLYGALAWLMARALAEPVGRVSRTVGAIAVVFAGLVFAAAAPLAMARLHDWSGATWGWLAAALFLAAGCTGALQLLSGSTPRAAGITIVLAVLAHGVLAGAFVPSLRPLWLSSRAAKALAAAGLSPSQGISPGPVTVAGYEEPSLVFLLGTATELGDAEDAAAAIAEGRPAIVEGRLDGAFHAALARDGATTFRVGEGAGLDYSNNHADILRLYRPPPERVSP